MGRSHILVIEDDAGIRQGVVDALQIGGYATSEASDGRSGLELALTSEWDLLLLDLLLPPHCAGCGREGAVLCADCAKPLRRRLGEPAGVPIGLPALMPSGLVQLEWCAMFSGSVREAIHALKYRGERRLTGPLAVAMAERWLRAGVGSDLVTWVPVHETRRRERGFDQAEELARSLAGSLRLPVAACLERHQRTAAQHALDRQQRAASTAGVFQVRARARATVAGHWVLLVDDVLTTGATLAGCAAVLNAAGATAVSAITLARDR